MTQRRQLLNWLWQVFLLAHALLPSAVTSYSVTENDEAFVEEMWGHLERKDQNDRQLFLGFGMKSAGDTCDESEECSPGLECSYLSAESTTSRCVTNKACLQREMNDMGTRFDPVAYKRMLLDEAGITESDLWQAREANEDNIAFASSAPVVAFMDTIENHREELTEMSQMMTGCALNGARQAGANAVSTAKGVTRSTGAFVGDLFSNVLNFFGRGEHHQSTLTATPSSAPSISPAPTVSRAPTEIPSSAPSRMVSGRAYLGFHMEGGLLVDASYSIFSAGASRSGNKRRFGRACLGFEAGGGGEISLLILVAGNKFANDIIGGSFLFDADVAVGAAMGVAMGLYVSGDMAGDSPLYIEGTLGSGVGFGVAGFSICRTARAERQDRDSEDEH